MKKKLLLLILSISAIGCGQKIPKTGTLSFNKTIKIIDQKAVDATVKTASKKFINNAKKITEERIKQNGGERMIGESSFSEAMARGAFNDNFNPNYLKDSFWLNKWEFKDSIITYTLTVNKKYPPIYYAKIDRKKNTITKNISLKTNRPETEPRNYNYIPEKNYKVVEHRDDTKIIKGYDCFKVVVETVERSENTPDAFMNFTFTMYVTEEIKCMYHPATKFKRVLDKYYPLEITETNDAVKGYEKMYTVTEIDLK
ncbi:hypothetical protein [Aquimarina algiphila]|uniref:Lipoprotein n=1 Tax=Aquimarina algiphila TaxID=2047982 RepID=A0A554VBF1_9FLAO|nr:hypothetical protein [Aquimarina algiphila]TSE03823.1 hypothetical protein FOF46_28375 [Aquimarina algiphila]